jgi:hypothetical protein
MTDRRTPTTASRPDARADVVRAGALRTHAPATPKQRTPHAPDTPWGRLRGARGWSLRHVGELTGVNIADLSRIERGIGGPTPDQARRLLAVYDGAR